MVSGLCGKIPAAGAPLARHRQDSLRSLICDEFKSGWLPKQILVSATPLVRRPADSLRLLTFNDCKVGRLLGQIPATGAPLARLRPDLFRSLILDYFRFLGPPGLDSGFWGTSHESSPRLAQIVDFNDCEPGDSGSWDASCETSSRLDKSGDFRWFWGLDSFCMG